MPSKRPYTQWTADTEIAFIMALRFHGRATLAAAELGKTPAGAYQRRKRCPDFAAKWEGALDEWRARHAAAAAPPARDGDDLPIVEHFDGFTKQRRRAFLRKLTETGDVEEACRYVRLSVAQAEQLRRDHASFRAAWDRALGQSVATLEQAAIDRAVNGVEEPVWHAGKIVGTRVVRSDSLLKTMLGRGTVASKKGATKRERIAIAEEAAKLAEGTFMTRSRTPEQVLDSINRKLDAIAARERRNAAAQAIQWLAEGKIP